MTIHVLLYLWVGSLKYTPSEMSERLNLKPTSSALMGEEHPRIPDRPYQEHRFEYRPDVADPLPFERKLDALLDDLRDREPQMREISSTAEWCQVNVAYYGWREQMWGLHMTPEQIGSLAKFGLSLGVDLYAHGGSG